VISAGDGLQGRGQTPKSGDRFVVQTVEPERTLVLGDDAGSMSWAFVLEPAGDSSTDAQGPAGTRSTSECSGKMSPGWACWNAGMIRSALGIPALSRPS
jgi:hypothetical protein